MTSNYLSIKTILGLPVCAFVSLFLLSSCGGGGGSPFNNAPDARDLSVQLDEDTSAAIDMSGFDRDGDLLTIIIIGQPAHGELVVTGAEVTYTPDADYFGLDSLSYKLSDDEASSGEGVISIDVQSVNDLASISIADINSDGTNYVTITYLLADVEGDICSIYAQYSNDGGSTWYDATLIGSLNGLLSNSGQKEVVWNVKNDLGVINDQPVMLKFRCNDGEDGAYVISSVFNVTAHDRSVVYVDSDAANGGDGLTWATAYNDLQDAITYADSNGKHHEVWVAEGVYVPGALVTDSFQLVSGVEFYGGFNGSESARIERDVVSYVCVLSGDLNNDSTGRFSDGDEANRTDDVYNVVMGANNTILDGFTIRYSYDVVGDAVNGGICNIGVSLSVFNCTIENCSSFSAGGMYNSSSNVLVKNCSFRYNTSAYGGGISEINGSASEICNSVISENTAYLNGGGVYCKNSYSTILNCVISGNKAQNAFNQQTDGGGVAATESLIEVRGCVIKDNQADYGGGISNVYLANSLIVSCRISGNIAIDGGGGVANISCNPKVSNCVIFRNEARTGSAIYNGTADTLIENCTIVSNNVTWPTSTASIRSLSSFPEIVNCIVWANTIDNNLPDDLSDEIDAPVATSYSLFSFDVPGVGNISGNPLFNDLLNNDYNLLSDSPAIDMGDNSSVSEPRDVIGESRIVDGPNQTVNSAVVDMGAYEMAPAANN